MFLFEIYKRRVEEHIQNNDLFCVTSYIRDDDEEAVKPMDDIRNIDFDFLRNGGVITLDGEVTDFNKDICRHRYTYICKLVDFIISFNGLIPYLCLKVQIVSVINNQMNVPQIFENNILTFGVLPQSFSLSKVDVSRSFSILYKEIKDNTIYGQNESISTFEPTPGYFFMEMKPYKE
jgi:hypothetical protein